MEIIDVGGELHTNSRDFLNHSPLHFPVTAVVGAGLVRDSWVEGKKSRYVVVQGIPEAEWVKDRMSKLKGGAGGAVWGRRAPVVTSRAGKAGAA